MAFFNCSIHSDTLGMAVSLNVIVPQKSTTQIGMKSGSGRRTFPVLYLLHGMSDDHSIWCRRTSIERYAAEYDLAIVMPNALRSFYTDMATGPRFWTFLSEELPAVVKGFFPISGERADTFAAGLSMGGYGALKLGLRCPEKYAAIGAMSAVTDIGHFMQLMDTWGAAGKLEADGFFGSSRQVPDDCDLAKLVRRAAELPPEMRPKIMHYCGTEDFLYQDNIAFRDLVRGTGAYDYSYTECAGTHNWEFWDTHIKEILKNLPFR